MQKNSDQIKEAPMRSADSKQIFRNFRDATAALLDCEDLPADPREAVCRMMDLFNTELGGADGEFEGPESDSENAYRVMSRVFGLPADGDEDIEEDGEAARAARDLGNAFAAIEKWRDYMPGSLYNPISEALMDWIINDRQFLHNPDALRAGLPGIFREVFKSDEDK
jgi:hypothetical protein